MRGLRVQMLGPGSYGEPSLIGTTCIILRLWVAYHGYVYIMMENVWGCNGVVCVWNMWCVVCLSTLTFLTSFYIEVYFHPFCFMLSTMDILQIIRSIVVVVCGKWLVRVILDLLIVYRNLGVLMFWSCNIGNMAFLLCFELVPNCDVKV